MSTGFRIAKGVEAFQNWGAGRFGPRDARRSALINLLALAAFCLNVLYCLVYVALDATAFAPIIVIATLHAAANLATPLFHRFGPTGAPIWLAVTMAAAIWAYSYTNGAGAGQQFFFLMGAAAGPVVFGAGRRRLAALFSAPFLAGLLAAEFLFTAPAAGAFLDPEMAAINLALSAVMAFVLLFLCIDYAMGRAEAAETALSAEFERSERLLANLVPEGIAERLKAAPDRIIADELSGVTILFADIVDFTPRAARMSAPELVAFLNRIFSAFDALAARHGLEKIKTIGDAYMAAAGLPTPREGHAVAIAEMALDMLEACEGLSDEVGRPVRVRIGFHTGPVVAGVIGTRKFFYDVWGDTVNTAARMESHGAPGRIQVTSEARRALGGAYVFERRGTIRVKGKEELETWWLIGRAERPARQSRPG